MKTGQFDVNHMGLVRQLGDVIHSELQQGFEHSPLWHTIRQQQVTSGYLQMVSGVVPEVSRYDMRVFISQGQPPQAHQIERIPGSDPVSTFSKDRHLGFQNLGFVSTCRSPIRQMVV